MRQDSTETVERNGGMHNQKAYRRIKAMLQGHGYKAPRLYHLVFKDDAAESAWSPRRFQNALKALCRKLRQKGVPYRWRACLERDKAKGLHCHVFMLVEGHARVNPEDIINTKQYGKKAWLYPMLFARHMSFYLSQPKADIHRTGGTVFGKRLNYATLAGDKMADCLDWISYLAKRRSKPEDLHTIYFSSRDKGVPKTATASPTVSPPA